MRERMLCGAVVCAALECNTLKKSEVKGMCLRSGALQWYKEKTDLFSMLLNLNICSACDVLGDKLVLYRSCVSYYIATIT